MRQNTHELQSTHNVLIISHPRATSLLAVVSMDYNDLCSRQINQQQCNWCNLRRSASDLRISGCCGRQLFRGSFAIRSSLSGAFLELSSCHCVITDQTIEG